MAGMKIPIDINLAQVRKSFGEMNKLQKKTWKTRQQQVRVEKKENKDELKRMAAEHKAKSKFMKEEMGHTKKLRDERGRFIKKEEGFTRKNRQNAEKDYRTTTDRMKKLDRQSKGGMIGRGAGMVGRAGMMVGGGLLGFAIGYGLKAAEMRKQAMQSFGPAIGSGGWGKGQGTSFNDAMKMKSKGGGGNLGFDINQRSGMIPGMSRATGSSNVVPMMEAMRATGMNQGEVGGAFGAMRAGGTSFAGKGSANQGKREFKELLAAGMASGLEKGRMPEFMSGVTSLMQQQQAMSAGDVGSGGIAKLAAALGQSGKSGFQGSRGMQLMGKLQQGILQPGGGESGMAFMRQAFGFGKPGGGATFYDAEKQREKGLGKDAAGFSTVMGELKSQYGTGEDAVLKMREVLGTSIEQGEELIRLSEAGNLSTENLARIDEIMKETEPIEKQAARAMKEAGTSLQKIAARMDQSVGNGAAAQKALDKIEDYQRKLFELMLKWAPLVLEGLQELIALVKAAVDFLTGNGKTAADKLGGTQADLRSGKAKGDAFPGIQTSVLQDRMLTEPDAAVREKMSNTIQARASALRAKASKRPGGLLENTVLGESSGSKNMRKHAMTEGEDTSWTETMRSGYGRVLGIPHAERTAADVQHIKDTARHLNVMREAGTPINELRAMQEKEAANYLRDLEADKRWEEALAESEGNVDQSKAVSGGGKSKNARTDVHVHIDSLDPSTVTNPKSSNPAVVDK